nr:unnamed protein product [Callosobruchus analis]
MIAHFKPPKLVVNGPVMMENQSNCEEEVNIKESLKEECANEDVKVKMEIDTDTDLGSYHFKDEVIHQCNEKFELKIEDGWDPEE